MHFEPIMLAGPLIGAIIGYITNYIAVKMLFRPYEAKYVFSKRLPLTPGIVPKSKDRVARAIASAVMDNLLTPEDLEKNLLKAELKATIESKVNEKIHKYASDQRKISDIITDFVDKGDFDAMMAKGERKTAEILTGKMLEMDVGQMVAVETVKAIKEQKIGNLVAQFFSDDTLYAMINPITRRINRMVAERGPVIISEKIRDEFQNIERMTVGEVCMALEKSGVDYGKAVVGAYDSVVRRKLPSVLKNIDIASMIQEKVDLMTPQEIEKLTLTVMKKELSAIVNLGLLIGFILGSANMVINMFQ